MKNIDLKKQKLLFDEDQDDKPLSNDIQKTNEDRIKEAIAEIPW